MRRALVIYDFVIQENYIFFFISASADENTGPQDDNLKFFILFWPDPLPVQS